MGWRDHAKRWYASSEAEEQAKTEPPRVPVTAPCGNGTECELKPSGKKGKNKED